MICARGHSVSRDQFYVYPQSGHLECRICQCERSRQRRAMADRETLRAYWRERKRITSERRGPKPRETFWTPENLERLRHLYVERGLTLRQVAWELDRREPGVRCKVARLKLTAQRRSQ